MPHTPPKIIFIVPYRDRARQKEFFSHHMSYVMRDYPPDSYKIYFSHQCDNREFNRGAVKNIGFLAMRDAYPDDYKNITFVFNDVDCMAFAPGQLDYETAPGVVKHFYGFKYTLGGIVSIRGGDFERTGGFPNLWAWSMEDNALQQRVLAAGLRIDRSVFFPINDENILHFRDKITRNINRTDFDVYMSRAPEGLHSIEKLLYEIDGDYIQIRAFSTGREENLETKKVFDLRDGNAPFGDDPYNKNLGVKMGLGVMRGGGSLRNMRGGGSGRGGGPKLQFL